MNQRADWLAWSLQFVVGLVFGALISLCFIRGGGGRRSLPLIIPSIAPSFTLGAALVGAALASYYGDQLWLDSSYRVIPPDAPQHSDISRRVSLITGIVGGGLILFAVARSFGILS